MHYLNYNEQIRHYTGEMPLAYYHVDAHHPRYHMRMHWHRETELIRMLRGTLRLYVNDVPLTVRAGDLVLVGEGVLHGGDAEDGVYECIVFDPYALLMHIEPCKNVMKGVIGGTLLLENRAICADEAFAGSIERLYAAVKDDVQGGSLKLIGALYDVFGYLSERMDARLPMDSSDVVLKAEHLKPALEYIERNYGSHITLDTLARLTGLSPKYFCRCFRAVIRRSPIEYLNHYRIECASSLLLSTDKTVAEIAQLCGYNDSSFFIKQFRRYKNTTPHRYRADGRQCRQPIAAALEVTDSAPSW